MALDLQVNTNNAAAAIDAINRGLVTLRQRLEEASGANLGAIGTQLASIRLDGSAAKGLADLAAASRNLNGTGLTTTVSALERLGQLNLGSAVAQVSSLAAGLAQIAVPRGLAQLAANLSSVATAAQQAATAVANLGAATGGAQAMTQAMNAAGQAAQRAQQGLQGVQTTIPGVTTGMGGAAAAANNARVATDNWHSSLSVLKGSLAAVGIQAGIASITNFAKEASDLGTRVSTLTALENKLWEDNRAGAQVMEFLGKTADETGARFSALVGTFGNFSAGMAQAKFGLAETETVFKNLAAAGAGLQLSGANMAGVFKAVEQMATKGVIQLEELKGQLGDRLPGAIGVFAQATGRTVPEVYKLAEAGQLSARELVKFSEALAKTFGMSEDEKLRNFGYQMGQLANAVEKAQLAFGTAFNAVMIPGVKALADAMNTPAFRAFASQMGAIAGGVLSALASGIATLASGIGRLAALAENAGAALRNFVGPEVYGMLGTVAAGAAAVGISFAALAPIIGRVTAAYTSYRAAQAAAAASAAASTGVMAALSGGFRMLWAALTPLNVGLLAVTVGIGLLVAYWQQFTSLLSAAVDWTYRQVDAFLAMVGASDAFRQSVAGTKDNVQDMGTAVQDTARKASEYAATLGGEVVQTVQNWTSVTGQATDASFRLSEGMGQSVDTAKKLTSAHDDGARAAAAYDRELNKMLADMDKEASNAEKAAAAQEKLGAARRSAASGGGGGSRAAKRGSESVYGTSDGYYGTAGDPSMSSYRGQFSTDGFFNSFYSAEGLANTSSPGNATRTLAPAALFTNAPKFAGGGLTGDGGPLADGGMPAILHPNEAVVPLTGGGAIPIAFTNQRSAGDNGRVIDTLRDVNQSVHVGTEATRAAATAIVNELQKLYDCVVNVETAINAMNDKMVTASAASSSSYSSGASTYSGSSYSSPMPSGSAASSVDAIPAEWYQANGYQKQVGPFGESWVKSKQFDDNNEGGSSAPTFGAVRPNAFVFGDLGSSPQADWIRTHGNLSSFFKDFDDRQKAAQDSLAAQTKANQDAILAQYNASRGFATGTPNTSEFSTDPNGFAATLHPGEAVIPLPDGRSVPVTLRAEASAPGGESQRPIVVNLNIYAKDVESFRRSKAQLTQELTAEMRKVERMIGNKRAVDDPTVR